MDLRRPSFAHLRLSEMVAHVVTSLGEPEDRAVVFGSSLGGLTACRVAERDARVCALVLLAPAFRMADRWMARLGAEAFDRWRNEGWLEVDDHARGGKSKVDFGFAEDIARVDVGWPDVRVPTLIVHGVRDEVVDIGLSRAWASGKRHVRLVEVDDGHELTASLDLIAREADRHLAGFLL